MPDASQRPLDGTLVVDLARYLPGAYASRELLRLGARVVRIEAPGGDPMRSAAPAADSWSVTANSTNGNTFTVSRSSSGAVTRS